MSRFSLAVSLSVVTIICFFLIRTVSEYDVWFHLTLGRDILCKAAVPVIDSFSLLNFGRPYIDSQWLFQVVIAAGYALIGVYWLQVVQVGLWGLAFYFVYRATCQWTSSAGSFLLLLLTAIACENRFTVRPELVSILMLALFYWRLQQGRYRTLKEILLLAALQVVWTNSHTMFIIGPCLVGCYFVASILRGLQGKEYADTRMLGLLTASTAFACILTPYGWNIIGHSLSLVAAVSPDTFQGGPSALKSPFSGIVEMQSPFSTVNRTTIAFWFYLLLMVAYLCSFAVLLAKQRMDLPIARTLVVLAMLAISVNANRNMPLFALVAAPLTAEYLSLAGSLLRRRVWSGILVFALAVAGLMLSPRIALNELTYVKHRFGAGISGDFVPLGLPLFLDRLGFTGPVFNSATLGGYYSFHGYPARIPFHDGRFNAYQPADLLRVKSIVGQGSVELRKWRDFSAEYDFKGILLEHDSVEAAGLLPLLPGEPLWRLVYLDNAASFWLRTDQKNLPTRFDGEQAAKLALNSDYFSVRQLDIFFEKTGMFAEQRLMLLEQATGNRNDLYLLQILGNLQLKTGAIDKAEQTFKRLLAIEPRSRTNLNSLAQTALVKGNADAAEECVLQALKYYPADPLLLENLALIRSVRVKNTQQ